jgi:hypothetical protein
VDEGLALLALQARRGGRLKPQDYVEAARVPPTLQPQAFGLWRIERHRIEDIRPLLSPFSYRRFFERATWPDYTVLRRATLRTLHLSPSCGEVVMEDTMPELLRHMPIWLAARGRVLVTGLGLGCVVRGLLASPEIETIDVVEIDRDIVRVVGAEFASNPRVRMHVGDALVLARRAAGPWDFAWHDLWRTPEQEERAGLQAVHAELMARLDGKVAVQGAWHFPREVKRVWPRPLLGARRRRVPA